MVPTIARTSSSATGSATGRRWSAAVVVAATLIVAGCSDDSSSVSPDVVDNENQQDAQPAPGSAGFSEGDFDAIPVARGATEVSERTERDGAIAQSFTATATSPEQIMEFYADDLPALGWDVVEPVRETGTDSYAAAWVQGQNRLEVSALLAQGVDDERTQFSLVLLPDRTAGEDVNDPATTDSG